MKSSLTVIAAALLCLQAFAADQVEFPRGSLLDQERQRIDEQRKQVFSPSNPALQLRSAGTPSRMPGDQAVSREILRIEPERKALFDPANPDTKGIRNNFPNVATPAPSNIDVEEIARRYEQKVNGRSMTDLMIFASFSLPGESLRRIIDQAHQTGASVVFRGFKGNSWKETMLAIRELGKARGNVLINPDAFVKYKVNAVPAVVLVKADASDQLDQDGCALPDTYAAISGDVSLDYALDELAKRAPQFEALAIRYGRALKR